MPSVYYQGCVYAVLQSFAYIVHCSDKVRHIEPEDNKHWAKYYTMLCMVMIYVSRNNISGIILPNGHCIYCTIATSDQSLWHQQDDTASVVYRLFLLHLPIEHGNQQLYSLGVLAISLHLPMEK